MILDEPMRILYVLLKASPASGEYMCKRASQNTALSNKHGNISFKPLYPLNIKVDSGNEDSKDTCQVVGNPVLPPRTFPSPYRSQLTI